MQNKNNIVPIANENQNENEMIFLTTEDVAACLGCSVITARQIMSRKDFPLIRVGKNYKVFKPAFEKWAMERRD